MATLMKLCLDTFKLPTENISDFRVQWSKLTDTDKADLKAAFEKEGITVDAPTVTK